MPAAAYALLAVFTALAAAAGLLATRLVGPWRRWAPIAPILASFASLYLVGHRLAWSIGPEVPIFGFRVALAWDVVVAAVTALVAALVQRAAVRLLEPKQRGASGHGRA